MMHSVGTKCSRADCEDLGNLFDVARAAEIRWYALGSDGTVLAIFSTFDRAILFARARGTEVSSLMLIGKGDSTRRTAKRAQRECESSGIEYLPAA